MSNETKGWLMLVPPFIGLIGILGYVGGWKGILVLIGWLLFMIYLFIAIGLIFKRE